MVTTLTLLAALISIMFVASFISVVSETRKEDEDFKILLDRSKLF
ncbi:hypothetical protein GGQ73_003724 [Rhizobium skierniewicense]|uniref:Uncharacterized protein n=1 Tax=Rhizobium skierniewicense TaxID=984260 RepID=A0A7W6C8M8_9HYPH|nr:hypothetical protein [Rhizobium skierniewicense]MBB3947753.1 hypothetical protein [Rhizobium skierniewicense]